MSSPNASHNSSPRAQSESDEPDLDSDRDQNQDQNPPCLSPAPTLTEEKKSTPRDHVGSVITIPTLDEEQLASPQSTKSSKTTRRSKKETKQSTVVSEPSETGLDTQAANALLQAFSHDQLKRLLRASITIGEEPERKADAPSVPEPTQDFQLPHFDLALDQIGRRAKYHRHPICGHRRRECDRHGSCVECRGYRCDYSHRCADKGCTLMSYKAFTELDLAHERKARARKSLRERAIESGSTSVPPAYDPPYYEELGQPRPGTSTQDNPTRSPELPREETKRKRKSSPHRLEPPPRVRRTSGLSEAQRHILQTLQDARDQPAVPIQIRPITPTHNPVPPTPGRDLAQPTPGKQSKPLTPGRSKTTKGTVTELNLPTFNPSASSSQSTPRLKHLSRPHSRSHIHITPEPSSSTPPHPSILVIDPKSSRFYSQLSKLASYLKTTQQTIKIKYDQSIPVRQSVLCMSNDPVVQASKVVLTTPAVASRSLLDSPIGATNPHANAIVSPIATHLPISLTDTVRVPANNAWPDPRAANRTPIRTPDFTTIPEPDQRLPRPIATNVLTDQMFPLREQIVELAKLGDFDLSNIARISGTDDTILGFPTHRRVNRLAVIREEENCRQDSEGNGRKYCTLAPTEELKVDCNQYESADGKLQIDPLLWPLKHEIWMPHPFRADTDIPLCELDAQYLEKLTRTALRVVNLSYYNTEVLENFMNKFRTQLVPEHGTTSHTCLQVLHHTNTDLTKLLLEILQSLVNLRRDAFLLHTKIPPEAALWLRARSFTHAHHLFEIGSTDRVHSFTHKQIQPPTLIRPPARLN